MPRSFLCALLGCASGCASTAVVTTVPVDPGDEDTQLWASVLREPLTSDPPSLSDGVRHALVSPTDTTTARRSGDDATLVATELLPLALESSMHPVLEDAAHRLRRGESPAEVLEETVAIMRTRRITCRAYRGVLFGGHPGRAASRDENAFVALEIAYFHLRGHERDVPRDPIDCGNEPPTALLRPQLVPYLAVAAGAEPTEVRARIATLLEAITR